MRTVWLASAALLFCLSPSAFADDSVNSQPVTGETGASVPDDSGRATYADLDAAIDAFAKEIAAQTRGKAVAVAPFLPLGPEVREQRLGEIAGELLSTRLVGAGGPGGPTVIERAQLDQILEEIKLSLLGLTDSKNASKVGQMLGAELVIVGSVAQTGDSISISARAVDTGSSEARLAWEARFPADTVGVLSEKYVVKRSRTDALFRSLLIPGWGQSYNGEDVKAGVFLGTGVALIGVSVIEYFRFEGARDDYRNATNTPSAIQGYDRMVDINRERNIVYAITGLFWGVNVADAFINGTSTSRISVEPTTVSRGGNGLQIAWRY